jgi:hypothetical protein
MATRTPAILVIIAAFLSVYAMSALACDYVVGDVNGSGIFNGVDVVFACNYLGGGGTPPDSCECPDESGRVWYVAGDVNASCSFNGLDVTYMVAYFKGGPEPHPCADCPPTP